MKINESFILFGFLAAVLAWSLFPPHLAGPPSAEKALRITDMSGQSVEFDALPSRIMMNTPVAWHYLTLTNSDEAITTIPPYMAREISVSLLGKIYPRLSSKPVSFLGSAAASQPSVEQAMTINPDAILTWNYLSRGFENAKIPGVVKIISDGGDKRKLFQTLGQLSGQPDRAEQLWARHQKEMDEFFASQPDDVKEKTLIVLGNNSLALWNSASNPHFIKLFETLGGRNLAEQTKLGNAETVNLETLLKLDPDIIYLNPYGMVFTTLTVGDIYTNPKLKGLKAVKNKRVYHMPAGAARLEGPVEEPLFMMWMYQTMHPEIEPTVNLRNKIKDAFMVMYHYDISTEEIDAWLRLSENRLSAGYGRFCSPEQTAAGK